MTVSNVLNNKPGFSASTRARVLAAAKEVGYTPNFQARALAGGRTQLIGLMSDDLTVQYTGEIMRGIAEELAESGYEIIISATYQDGSREQDRASFLLNGVVDGLLLIAPALEPELVARIAESGVPAVVIDPRQQTPSIPSVGARNYDGVMAATEWLLDRGHSRIGFIGGTESFSSSAERFEGYRDALADRGVVIDEQLVIGGDYSQVGGFAATLALLALRVPPTAILAMADVTAFGAMDAIKSLGLSIPSDVSVVGFDDIPQSTQTHPALTTVRQPLADIGRTGARMLTGLIRGEQPEHPHLKLDTRLVVRDSAAELVSSQEASGRA